MSDSGMVVLDWHWNLLMNVAAAARRAQDRLPLEPTDERGHHCETHPRLTDTRTCVLLMNVATAARRAFLYI